MSDDNATCEYVLDPDDPETWGGEADETFRVTDEVLNENRLWTCPHDSEDDENLCLFHLPSSAKDDESVTQKFLETIGENNDEVESKRSNQFFGSNFGDFEIAGRTTVTTNSPIYLSYSYFGKINAEGTSFKNHIDFSGCVIEDSVCFNNAKFYENSSFFGVDFRSFVSFNDAEFHHEVYFTLAEFIGSANFQETEFKGYASFQGAEFEGQGKEPRFAGATFSDGSNFVETNLENGEFPWADLTGSDFSGIKMNKANFEEANLTDANLSNASMQGANLENAILSRSDLFDTNLIGASFYAAVFGEAQINEGTEFGDRCVYDPKFDREPYADIDDNKTGRLTKAGGQYRITEQLARTNALPDRVGHNFIRRQDIHREQHRQEGRWGRWLRATASKYVLEYGENPWRLIATGILIVIGFGLLYPLVGGLQPTGGSPITASRVIENPFLLAQSIYYSTLTFTTLGMGDFQPVGLGRILTTLETSLGAIIIALLVFVFGRRAAR